MPPGRLPTVPVMMPVTAGMMLPGRLPTVPVREGSAVPARPVTI
jgi:hypothetical protein